MPGINAIKLKRLALANAKGIRKVRPADIPHIKKLVSIHIKRLFGNVNVDMLINKSYLSIVLENTSDEIVAALCANNYPNVPSIPPWGWESWLFNLYKMKSITPRNSLWVHLAAFDNCYSHVFLPLMLKHIFAKCMYVKFVFFVVPPHSKFIQWLEKVSTQIAPYGYSDPSSVQTLYACMRQNYVTNYKIRRAVVEDNDDIVPLIDRHSARLKEIYGEFYIAELIMSHQDSGRQLIVAEKDGYAVAVMCLNDKVNYDVLVKTFKLEPFYGLRKPDRRDRFTVSEFEDYEIDDYDFLTDADFVMPISGECEAKGSSCSLRSREHEASDDIILDIDFLEESQLVMPDFEERDDDQSVVGALTSNISVCYLTFTDDDIHKLKRRANMDYSSSQYSDSTETHPQYYGAENAFVLEIAAAQPELVDSLLVLLEASFQCFPEKDYCVLCIPSEQRTFPLLQKMFVRVTPRATSNFPHELYVAHRCAVAGKIGLRPAFSTDKAKVGKLMRRMRASDKIMDLFDQSMDLTETPYQSYVATCQQQIVGLAILSDMKDAEYDNSHYQVNNWTDLAQHKLGGHGKLDQFIVSPIFQKHGRFFLQELHRHSDYSIIYYQLPPIDDSSTLTVSNILAELIPVVPSKMPEYPKVDDDCWELPEVVGRCASPYALYISTLAHCGLSRYEVNTRIVVVGASDVGISFLIGLLYKNNPNYRITYNNVTLVSTHGVRRQQSNRIRELLIPITGDLSNYSLALYSLKTYVNTVHGVMSAIDRKNKTITVNGTQLPYDVLILTCGLQFQMLERAAEIRSARIECPSNVFVVNTDRDADEALFYLKQMLQQISVMNDKVIIYGNNIESYCCLTAMIEMGIPKPNIALVIPPSESDQQRNTFHDYEILEAVHKAIVDEGVSVHEGYEFMDWTFNDEVTAITQIRFQSRHHMLDIDCMAIFAYTERIMSRKTFLAISQASLVFDGALVVEPDCQTNDPNIYAAGTITKYPRRYYADHMLQKYFNRIEIGQELAETIMERLIPHIHVAAPSTIFSHCVDRSKLLVPQYHQPLLLYCLLPGQLRYMKVQKPGRPVPFELSLFADDYGQLLTSGDPTSLETQGYFKLHLNQHSTVETITCLSQTNIERVNLAHLWGKHEVLLNNLVKRFEMILITDLFAYFREPWTYALYHDRFDKFNDESTEILISLAENPGESIIEDIVKVLQTSRKLTKETYSEIEERFIGCPYQQMIETKFQEFLTDNLLYLPMYAHPVLVNMILGAYEQSLLFMPM